MSLRGQVAGPDPNPAQDGRRDLPEYLDVMFVAP
jgi:hypothetical protein